MGTTNRIHGGREQVPEKLFKVVQPVLKSEPFRAQHQTAGPSPLTYSEVHRYDSTEN